MTRWYELKKLDRGIAVFVCEESPDGSVRKDLIRWAHSIAEAKDRCDEQIVGSHREEYPEPPRWARQEEPDGELWISPTVEED